MRAQMIGGNGFADDSGARVTGGFTFDDAFERHPQHSRHRRAGTRSASTVNLLAVCAGDAKPGMRP